MKIAIQKIIMPTALCLTAFMLVTACGAKEAEVLSDGAETVSVGEEAASDETAVTSMDEEAMADAVEAESADGETADASETASAASAGKFIPEGIIIDFDSTWTSGGEYDGYTLILVCTDESAGTYELHLYNKDKKLVQQFPCGELREPISISFDNLNYADSWVDLEIFSSGSQSGLLFVADLGKDERKLFYEPIEIPLYEESTHDGFLVVDENEEYKTTTYYQINRGKAEPFRRYTLQKENNTLEIWDCLDNKSIFTGQVSLQEDGSLVNEEYYQSLLLDNLYHFNEASEDEPIPVWVVETDKEAGEQSGFEWAQEEVFGNTGHTAEYENRQDFLADFGFADKEPYYQYYDSCGNLQLELFLDEAAQKGCGLLYQYNYTYQLGKEASIYGFVFDALYQGEWKAADPYDVTAVTGSTREEDVREYEEIIEYTEDGKLDYYKSMAFVDWIGPEEKTEKDTLLEINYIYRDDGTLYYRVYHHNSMVWETTDCSMSSYYDELGRIVYKKGYVTHGSAYEYYIYDNNGNEPKYYLYIDKNLGYCIPALVRFH
ncbi:MAG: DUF3876 domain-containing protein [Clostridium sp.]|nr:DUF3876 domain-containing protein [Clostridium sp.]